MGARYTVLAFIGLFNVATFNLDFYSQILAGGIAIFLFYIISDAFSVFWNGINLKYLVATDSIIYQWGVTRTHELIIPYNKITKISSFYGKDEKRCAIIFDNIDNIKNRDFGFSKEIYFNQLTFEMSKILNL